MFDTGVATGIYSVVADQYDRLVIAYKNGSNADVARLTSNGELDITFGTGNTGIISSALTNIGSDESSVRATLDDAGRIVVVALNSGATGVQVAAFDNGTAALGNGAAIGGYTAATPVTGFTGAVVTSLVPTEDGKMLIGGYQSGTNAMWVARLTSTGTLDTTFNPTTGIKTFTFDGTATARLNYNLAIFEDGRISVTGHELVGGIKIPYVARVYNEPYQEEISESLDAQPIGTNDYTFGLTGNNIVTFFASPLATALNGQKARSLGIQGNNRFVVAVDGKNDSDAASKLFITRLNMDGILDRTFNTTGRAEIASNYDNEYVKDMVVFTTPAGVNKAILAGYASNTVLSRDNSLLLSYNLDSVAVDSTFGGFDQDPVGQSFADIKSHQTIGMQTSGRIVTGGLNYDNVGAILGYTQTGKLDKTFGADGYFFTASTTGLYTHAIDTSDRIVFAYANGSNTVVVSRLLADGAGLDTSFNTTGSVTTGISSVSNSNNIRVAIDQAGKIVVAAMSDNGLSMKIERYNSNGTLDVSKGVAVAGDIIYGFTAGTINKLIIDQNNKIVVVGSDEVAGLKNIYVFRILANMSGFDTTFNASGTQGYIIYNNTEVQNPLDAIMHPDGRVVVVGSES